MDNPKEREVDRSQFSQWCYRATNAQSAVSTAAVAGDALLLVLQTTALRRAPKMATTLQEGCYQQHRRCGLTIAMMKIYFVLQTTEKSGMVMVKSAWKWWAGAY